MSKTRAVLLSILVALAFDHAAPAFAQPLPIFPTKRPKKTATPTPLPTQTVVPQATRTATPTVTVTRTQTPGLAATTTRTATRTPTPVPTSGAARPDMTAEIQNVQIVFGASVAAGDVAEGCAESTTNVDLLRFSALSRNVGTADLVLGDPECPTPCTEHPLEVCGNPDYVCSPAAGHNHPHYANYARYELLDQSGDTVVVGHKQGYCLRDTNCANPIYTCANQGISAGCYDTYDSSLGCQYLDITGIPGGTYLLRVTIDPLRQIPEVSDDNNVTQQTVTFVRSGQATATPVRTSTPARTGTAVHTTTPVLTPPPTETATPTTIRTATPPPVASTTATPARTATAGPPSTPTRSLTPSPQATISPVATVAPSPSPSASPVDPDGTLASVCQRAILQAGRMLVTRTFAGLDECGAAVAACEVPRRRNAACRDRAADACAEGNARIAAARATFVERVLARCEALGDDGMLAGGGLGHARRADGCGRIDDVAALASCIAEQHVCRTGGLVETEEPRLGARIGRGGMAGADVCVADLGGPDPEGPELTEARALDGCSRAIRRAGRRFVRHRVSTLQSCLVTHTSCLRTASGRDACHERARVTCDARKTRLAADPDRLAATIERGCGGIDMTLVRASAGVNLEALEARCAELGVPSLGTIAAYAQCLAHEHACGVDEILRYEAPRSDGWLGAWPPPGGVCPGSD